MLDHSDKPSAAARDGQPDDLVRLANYATIGIFAIAAIAVLKLASDVMVPIFAAVLAGSILARVAERLAGFGLPQALANIAVVGFAIAAGLALIAGLIEPLSGLAARAPDITRAVQEMAGPLLARWSRLASQFGQPAAGAPAIPGLGDAMSWAAAFMGRLTPALEQMLVFFTCLAFFVAGRDAMRKRMVLAMTRRSSRLSTLRVIAAVEKALTLYFLTTATVYAAVGAVTGAIAAAFGFANPALWGAMTFAAGYIPYLGVALVAFALAVAGVLSHHHGLLTLLPAGLYLCAHLFSETAVMPTLLGRRHEVNPFLIFLSIVFWSWMWGPVGAILAVPLLLTAQSLLLALSARDPPQLP
jgi:predicted PurR-regulated permease PerM